MITLYDKHETAEQTVFEFHFMPVVSLIFFLAVLAAMAPGCRSTKRVVRRCGILLILWMIGLLPAAIELEQAMRAGSVLVSGSKFSFTNPLRVVIPKT
jgi:hypothetical protein